VNISPGPSTAFKGEAGIQSDQLNRRFGPDRQLITRPIGLLLDWFDPNANCKIQNDAGRTNLRGNVP
jgi:hypothetical protein